MPFSSLEELRTARDAALIASDHLMLEDAPYPKDRRDMALSYRQELRDLPQRAKAEGLEAIELPDYSAFFRWPVSNGESPAEDSSDQAEDLPLGAE